MEISKCQHVAPSNVLNKKPSILIKQSSNTQHVAQFTYQKCNLGICDTASCITVLVYVSHLPPGRISIALQYGAMIQIHGW